MPVRPLVPAAFADHRDRATAAWRLVLLVAGLFAAVHGAWAQPVPPPVMYKIVTASDRGTYIQIGRDLSRFVAPQAGIQLEALPSRGSAGTRSPPIPDGTIHDTPKPGFCRPSRRKARATSTKGSG